MTNQNSFSFPIYDCWSYKKPSGIESSKSLSALIFTREGKSFLNFASSGGPCGVPEEKWLPIFVLDNKDGTYSILEDDSSKTYKNMGEVRSFVRKYVQDNYKEIKLED